jgi:hypothetical protein
MIDNSVNSNNTIIVIIMWSLAVTVLGSSVSGGVGSNNNTNNILQLQRSSLINKKSNVLEHFTPERVLPRRLMWIFVWLQLHRLLLLPQLPSPPTVSH